TRNLRPLAEFVYNHLRPDGFALIGDPNRTTADAFDTIARHCDLTVELLAVEGADQDAKQAVCGRLFRLRPKAC
ncbi:MAG: hypothetical protein KKB50_05010, partial [Planctomycetes bacterium]|nr:hypothetical protein [Planctomycetota bacterium]